MQVTSELVRDLQTLLQQYVPPGWEFYAHGYTVLGLEVVLTARYPGDDQVIRNAHTWASEVLRNDAGFARVLFSDICAIFASVTQSMLPRVLARVTPQFDTIFGGYLRSLEGTLPHVGDEYPQAIRAFLRQVHNLLPLDYNHLQFAYELQYGYWRGWRGEELRRGLQTLVDNARGVQAPPTPRVGTYTGVLRDREGEYELDMNGRILRSADGVTWGGTGTRLGSPYVDTRENALRWTGVAYGGGEFVAVTEPSPTPVDNPE